MRTIARNAPPYAGIPSNAPTARPVYLAIDIVRNANLGFGGDQRQAIDKYKKNGTEPERTRFAQTETEGHSEPSFGQTARL
ncbi:hypothetical protein CUV01_00215 [Paracoccus tegillarcae]|uniref:Uncharacterized protein n=1 Tax=Paracoccus tegillarcae TaxID=1529068 RepID=A0A2K9EKD2_9RHOB|nr:hypothetical protein CUV01_00215 [Paracoccus tegillarcae]